MVNDKTNGRKTLILGIDTSCDDTSASVVKNGRYVLSNIVSSQAEIHKKYGGIVPELASRRHIEMIWPIVNEALVPASRSLDDLSGIAVCYGPGLIGSLLVGCCFAKAIAYSKKIPLIGVNHLEGHIFSVFLQKQRPSFPFLSLVVSGGHTSLIRVNGFGSYQVLGRTRDDAAGEAYDKVAKLLGLGYPGGPIIDTLSENGNPESMSFPRPFLKDSYDFSFSGLKTAVRNYIEGLVVKGMKQEVNYQSSITHYLSPTLTQDICASFQRAVVDVLVTKAKVALKEEGINCLTLSGGVAANKELRTRMKEMTDCNEIELFIPPIKLCTDNAAMIAAAGHLHLIDEDVADLDLTAKAYLPL